MNRNDRRRQTAARLLFATFAVAVLAAIPLSGLAGPIIWIDDDQNNLIKVDTATGAATTVGRIPSSAGLITDIAFSPSGELWGTTFSSIYKINTSNASVTFVGNHGIGGANALTFGTNGTLYAAGVFSSSLYTVNTTSGIATALPGNMGAASGGDLVFNGGQLYLSGAGGQLFRLDIGSTVNGTNVGAFSVGGVLGLATDDLGRLLAASSNNIFQVNPSTGALTLLTSYSGFGPAFGATAIAEASPPPPPRAQSPAPTVLDLAKFSDAAYGNPLAVQGYNAIAVASPSPLTPGFSATAFANAAGDRIVFAITGTDQLLDWIGPNAVFVTPFDIPTPVFTSYVVDAANALIALRQANPNAEITLTGHSLGGALAQVLASATGLQATTFNAPGVQEILPHLASLLAPLNAFPRQIGPEPVVNYRLYGDLVSTVGTDFGAETTLDPGVTLQRIDADPLLYAKGLHGISAVIGALAAGGTPTASPGPTKLDAVARLAECLGVQAGGANAPLGTFRLTGNVRRGQLACIDPAGVDFWLAADVGSPYFQSVTFPYLFDLDALFQLQLFVNGAWSSIGLFNELATYDFGSGGVDQFRFQVLDQLDLTAPPFVEPFLFDVSFVSDGAFSGMLTVLSRDNAVSEPNIISLLLVALSLLVAAERRRKRTERAVSGDSSAA